jgi:hypothetical protein
MLPFILAAVGGYLIGDSFGKEIDSKFAEGGMIEEEVDGNTEVKIGNWIFYFKGVGNGARLTEIYHKPTDLDASWDTTYHRDLAEFKNSSRMRRILTFTHPTMGDFGVLGGFQIIKERTSYVDGSMYAKGGMMAKGGVTKKRSLMSMANLVYADLLAEKIKDWYTKTYPTDDLGEQLNDNVTFTDLWNGLHKKENVYEIMGVGDSIIRERLFEHLSEITGVDYDYVYKKWLESAEYAKGGIFSSKRDLSRDRMFKSQQSWEQKYKRKSKPKNPHYN